MKSLVVFTDGACLGNPGPGGWGAIISWPDQTVVELGGDCAATTNNRMELQSVIDALEKVAKESGSKALAPNVKIYSDSQYVLKGIQEWILGWKKKNWKNAAGKPVANQDLWVKLDEQRHQLQAFGYKLEWIWVKGHSNVPGNERCDQIASAFAAGQDVQLYSGPLTNYSQILLME